MSRRGRHYQRHRRLYLPVVTLLVVLWQTPGVAWAQLFERATVIRGARIITMDGPAIETGDILIKGGRIQAIGPKVELPLADRLTAKAIDATGKTVTPGLIDAWGGLGRVEAVRQPDATANSFDAFDGYARDDFLEAVRNGVTTLFLAPAGVAGIKGTGAVLRLASNETGSFGKLLATESALCIDLGSEQAAVARMKTYQDVRRKFRAAVEYRKALEDYQEDLKEYLEKLEERRKEQDKDKPSAGPAGEKKPDEKAKEHKSTEQPKPNTEGNPGVLAPPGNLLPGLSVAASDLRLGQESGVEGEQAQKEEQDSGKKSEKEGAKEGEKKKEDELKKPVKPKFDPTSETLLRAIDHKLKVRIEAHRSADILNALALAEEYNLDIILEGATDAYLVADQIANARVPVVLSRTVRTDVFEPNEFRRHTRDNAARLREAGVRCAIGTGGDPAATRFVAINAQLAYAVNAPGESADRSGGILLGQSDFGQNREADWLGAVTAEAADLLGLELAGRLRKGAIADLVIWNGDPADPASRVERVLIGGEPVYPPAK